MLLNRTLESNRKSSSWAAHSPEIQSLPIFDPTAALLFQRSCSCGRIFQDARWWFDKFLNMGDTFGIFGADFLSRCGEENVVINGTLRLECVPSRFGAAVSFKVVLEESFGWLVGSGCFA